MAKFYPLGSEEVLTGPKFKFYPLEQAEEAPQPKLKFYPVDGQKPVEPSPQPVSSGRGSLIPPLAFEPQPDYRITQVPATPAPVTGPLDIAPPSQLSGEFAAFGEQPAESPEELAARPGSQFLSEFGKGATRAAVVDLPSMYEQIGLFKDVGVTATLRDRLNFFDQIDRGEITSPEQLRGGSISVSQARSYLATTPENRTKMRERLLGQVGERRELIDTALQTLRAYQEDAKAYKPLVDKPRNIGSVADFTNWLGSTMGSGAVQAAPVLLAALTTGGVGAYALGAGMGVSEAVSERLKYIQEQTKGLPAQKQADAIIEYLEKTGDTSLLAGLTSGALDLVLGPAARLIKLRAGEVAKAATRKEAVKRELKEAPKSIAGEGVTGAAQQAIQIAAGVQLKEKPEFWTKENIIDILESGAAEAAGSVVGAGVPVAMAATRAPEGARVLPATEAAPTRIEPTFEGATPAPTASSGRVEPTLGPVGAPVQEPAGRVEPTLGEQPVEALRSVVQAGPSAEQQVRELLSTFPFLSQEDAQTIVQERMVRDQAKMEQRAAVEPPIFRQPPAGTPEEARLQEIFNDLMAKGMPPEQATLEAQRQFAAEQTEGETETPLEGEPSVRQAVSAPSGEGVSVAGEPSAGTPTPGVGVVEPDGVVYPGADVGEPAGREAAQPGAVTQPAVPEFLIPGAIARWQPKGEPPLADDGVLILGKPYVSTSGESVVQVMFPNTLGSADPKGFDGEGATRHEVRVSDLSAPPYTPSPAVAARITELENEQKGLLTKAGKVPAPKSKARVRYEELQSEIDLIKSGAIDIVNEIEQTARNKQGEEVARTNAAMAYDQRRDYESLEDAFDSYRENVRDTLTELGIRDQFTEEAALRAFDAEVEKLRAAETPTVEGEARAPATTEAGVTTEAPAAKRGRPKVERAPEKQAELEGKRRSTRNAVAKADYGLKKAQNLLDESTKPLDESVFATEEDLKEAQDTQRANKREAIKQLVQLADAPEIKGTAVHKRVKQALADSRISPQEVADIRRGLEVAKKTLGDKGSVLSAYQGVFPVNSNLSTVTTGQQAIDAVLSAGTPFQRLLARRIRKAVKNVKVVVLEQDSATPEELKPYLREWNRANGMYVPSLDMVFLRGSSFGGHQGVNNVTALHELVHAATIRKLSLGIVAMSRGLDVELALQKFVGDVVGTMDFARSAYDRAVAKGAVNPAVQRLVERTKGEVFNDPLEFVAYGLTDPDFQTFLMNVRMPEPTQTGFSKFVRAVMQLFGIDPSNYNAFSNIVNATDKVISARVSDAVAKRIVSDPGRPLLQRNEKLAKQEGIRSAKELKAETDKALNGLRKSKASELHKHMSALQKARDAGLVSKALDFVYSKADYATKRVLANATSFDFLARWTEKELPPIKNMYRVVQKMLGHITQIHNVGVSQIQMLDRYFKADKTLEVKLNDLLPLVTIAEVNPADPNAIEREPRLDQMYADLGPQGQEAYRRILAFHEGLREYQEFLLDQNIRNMTGLSEDTKKNLLAQIYKKFQEERRIEPYLPLVRDPGQFWLATGEGDNTKVYIYETREQRAADAERIAREDYGKPLGLLLEEEEFGMGNNLSSLRGRVDLRGTMLPQLFNAIDSRVPDTPSEATSLKQINEQLKNDIFDIWLSMLPEQAFRKQFSRRANRPGYRPDIRRNIASHVSRVAPALSRLKYSQPLRSEQLRLQNLIRHREDLTPFADSVEERINSLLSPRPHGVWDAVAGAANKLTYLTYLTGASTALLQPFGVLISGIPILTANHSANPAVVTAELLKNAVYFKQYGITKRLPNGDIEYTAPTLANNRSLPEDERRAIQAMVTNNVANNTYAGFLWDANRGDEANVVKGAGAKAADIVINGLLRNTERLTREVLYLSSYRLGRRRGLSEEEAIQQAAEDTKEALGDYDLSNKPKFMQGPLGRVAFSMKMYPVIMIQQLFGSMYRALPFLNKEGKAQALTKFSGLMMTSAMLAGAYNMPFADLIITMLTKFLDDIDDEDKPEELKDIEPVVWFKTVWMPDKLGSYKIGGVPLDKLVGEGALSAMTNLDLGKRIGLNDLWARDGKPSSSIPEAMQAFMISYFGGPITSYALSVGKAMEDFAVGDYYKAIERVVPLAIARNFMTAYRSKEEGYETPKGEIVSPEDVSRADIVWQSIGFSPLDVGAARDTSFKLTGAEQQILNQRNLLLRRLKFADRKDKDELMDKVIVEDIPKFNAKFPGYEIKPNNIKDILEAQRKQLLTSRAGVAVNKKNQRLFEESVESLEDQLEQRQK